MNTNVKIALVLAALVAAVIGATIITQFTEGEEKPKVVGPAVPGAGGGGMPLSFKDASLFYDPRSDSYGLREFPGFYEVNKEIHWATYLLRNPNPVPVKVTALSRNCTACTSGRLAVLPPDDNRAMRRNLGLQAAAGGLQMDPEVALYRRADAGDLPWQPLNFEKPDEALVVPAALDAATPTWCVLQLGFEMTVNGFKALEAQIGMQAEGAKAPAVQMFKLLIFGDSAQRVNPNVYDYGVISERSDPKTIDIFYWSTTRPQSAFAPPKVGGLDGDPFLSASAPVPLSAAELDDLARRASKEAPVRARGGYKFRLTLRRTAETPAGSRELDIGPVERQVSVGAADSTTAQYVQLTATVTGLVALAEGDVVNLGDFRGRVKSEWPVKLTSSRTDLELEPANDGGTAPRDRNPPGVTLTPVGTPVVENGVKKWTFTMTIAPAAFSGALSDRLLVFRVKGSGQFVRIPLKGTANSR